MGTDKETVEDFRSFFGAAIVTPERNLALPPEIIRPQDGAGKQDCERNALKRWLGRIAPRLNPVCPGDDRLACQPICDAIFRAGASFILTAGPASHKTLHEALSRRPVQTLRRTVTTGKRKITRRVHSYRWLEDVPIRSGAGAFRVTWIGHEIPEPASGKVRQSFARMTNLPVDRHNVREIAECGRARWKVENEGFNILENNGYHLDRNFGHDAENLASVLLVLNLLAFAMQTACDLAESAWQDARQAAGSRDRMFRQLQVLAARVVFEARASLLDDVADKVEIPPWPGAGQPPQGSRTHPKNEETPDTQADDAIMRIAGVEGRFRNRRR